MDGILLGVLVYVAAMLGIGFVVGRRIKNEEDYLLGGRRLGPLMTTFTVFATWFGAETCIGAAGQAYSGGISAVAVEPFGYGLAVLLVGLILAVPLYRLRLTTLADLFRSRYGVRAEQVSVLLMVPTSILWAAAQIRAFGQILAGVSGIEVGVAVTLAAVVVIVYTSVGGFMADAVSDLVQGWVLAIGLLVLAIGYGVGGPPADLLALPAERLRLVASGSSWLDVVELFAVPAVGSLVAQELIARVLAARSPGVARGGTIAGAALYFVIGMIPVSIGLAAAQGGMLIDDPEQLLVTVASNTLPPWLFVIFTGALISAILSTVDSALLVSGSLVAHNLVLPLRPDLGGAARVRVNRIAVVAAGVFAYALTFSQEGVWGLVLEASGFGSAGIVVCLLLGLFTRFGAEFSAVSAMLAGLVVYAAGNYLLDLPHPFITSLAAALLAYVLGAMVSALPMRARHSVV